MTTMITFQDQKSSGIKSLLAEEKIYGPAVVNSVMSGRNYIWGKRRISLIVEAMEQLQVHSFVQSSDGGVFSELFDKIDELVIMICDPSKNQVNITSQWNKYMKILEKLKKHSVHSRQVVLQRVTYLHTGTIS